MSLMHFTTTVFGTSLRSMLPARLGSKQPKYRYPRHHRIRWWRVYCERNPQEHVHLLARTAAEALSRVALYFPNSNADDLAVVGASPTADGIFEIEHEAGPQHGTPKYDPRIHRVSRPSR